jgi:hypothetical protein
MVNIENLAVGVDMLRFKRIRLILELLTLYIQVVILCTSYFNL